MKVLLVFATGEEAGSLDSQKNSGFIYDLIITGPGMVATTYHLTRKLVKNKYDLVINAGIAGSFKREFPIGEVVHIVSDCFSDFGTEDGEVFLSASEIGLTEPNQYPFKKDCIRSTGDLKENLLPRLRKVHGVTVNRSHGKKRSIQETVERLNPDTESMEGAAVFYVCALEKVPCLQIRAISNYVERRNRDAWDIPLAIKNLHKTLYLILDKIQAK